MIWHCDKKEKKQRTCLGVKLQINKVNRKAVNISKKKTDKIKKRNHFLKLFQSDGETENNIIHID